MDRPFIYIAALMRSGSTMLSEALTAWPYSFIFREPDLGKNALATRPGDVEFLKAQGIDIEAFWRQRVRRAFLQRRLRAVGYPQDYMVRAFKDDLLAELDGRVQQVGVKEVHNLGWQNYLKHFPDMRVLLMARDPRDIYISNVHRFRRGILKHKQRITTEETAAELNAEFRMQLALSQAAPYMKIRYEDLCLQPDLLDAIKAFVDSPIPGMGELGQFIGKHPDRQYEQQLHGQQISAQSVWRWTREPEAPLVAEAQQVFELMPEYCDYWSYPKSP